MALVPAVDAVAQLLESGLAKGIESARDRRDRADRPERLAVYRQFQRDAFGVMTKAQLVRSMVPGFIGGAWTFPTHRRRLRSYEDTAENLLLSLSDLRLIGNPEPRAVGERIVSLLGKLVAAPVPKTKGDIPRVLDGMKPVMSEIGEQLKVFTEMARRDLGHDKVRSHRWQLWRPKTLPWPGGWPIHRSETG